MQIPARNLGECEEFGIHGFEASVKDPLQRGASMLSPQVAKSLQLVLFS